MKKIIIIFAFFAFLLGCDTDGEDQRFSFDSDSGWVQFPDNNTSSIINLSGSGTSTLEIPLNLRTATNLPGLTVGYSISSNNVVSGSGEVIYEPGSDIGVLMLSVDNGAVLTEPGSVDITLTNTDRANVSVGLSDGSKPIVHNITINCASNVGTSYTGDSFSNDLGIAAGSFPAFMSTFTPVAGTPGSWDLDTTWGPDFVSLLCGGCVPPGSFPYPSTVTLNPDNTVTVTGVDFYTSGGTGTYNTCADEFTLNIGQALFNGDFTVDVVLTGN